MESRNYAQDLYQRCRQSLQMAIGHDNARISVCIRERVAWRTVHNDWSFDCSNEGAHTNGTAI